jgi:hypothetical protein
MSPAQRAPDCGVSVWRNDNARLIVCTVQNVTVNVGHARLFCHSFMGHRAVKIVVELWQDAIVGNIDFSLCNQLLNWKLGNGFVTKHRKIKRRARNSQTPC